MSGLNHRLVYKWECVLSGNLTKRTDLPFSTRQMIIVPIRTTSPILVINFAIILKNVTKTFFHKYSEKC